jgi:hypothetical protein
MLCRTCFLKHDIEETTSQEDEGEDVSSYWIAIRKRGDTGTRKRKHNIVLGGELAFEEDMDLS